MSMKTRAITEKINTNNAHLPPSCSRFSCLGPDKADKTSGRLSAFAQAASSAGPLSQKSCTVGSTVDPALSLYPLRACKLVPHSRASALSQEPPGRQKLQQEQEQMCLEEPARANQMCVSKPARQNQAQYSMLTAAMRCCDGKSRGYLPALFAELSKDA